MKQDDHVNMLDESTNGNTMADTIKAAIGDDSQYVIATRIFSNGQHVDHYYCLKMMPQKIELLDRSVKRILLYEFDLITRIFKLNGQEKDAGFLEAFFIQIQSIIGDINNGDARLFEKTKQTKDVIAKASPEFDDVMTRLGDIERDYINKGMTILSPEELIEITGGNLVGFVMAPNDPNNIAQTTIKGKSAPSDQQVIGFMIENKFISKDEAKTLVERSPKKRNALVVGLKRFAAKAKVWFTEYQGSPRSVQQQKAKDYAKVKETYDAQRYEDPTISALRSSIKATDSGRMTLDDDSNVTVKSGRLSRTEKILGSKVDRQALIEKAITTYDDYVTAKTRSKIGSNNTDQTQVTDIENNLKSVIKGLVEMDHSANQTHSEKSALSHLVGHIIMRGMSELSKATNTVQIEADRHSEDRTGVKASTLRENRFYVGGEITDTLLQRITNMANDTHVKKMVDEYKSQRKMALRYSELMNNVSYDEKTPSDRIQPRLSDLTYIIDLGNDSPEFEGLSEKEIRTIKDRAQKTKDIELSHLTQESQPATKDTMDNDPIQKPDSTETSAPLPEMVDTLPETKNNTEPLPRRRASQQIDSAPLDHLIHMNTLASERSALATQLMQFKNNTNHSSVQLDKNKLEYRKSELTTRIKASSYKRGLNSNQMVRNVLNVDHQLTILNTLTRSHNDAIPLQHADCNKMLSRFQTNVSKYFMMPETEGPVIIAADATGNILDVNGKQEIVNRNNEPVARTLAYPAIANQRVNDDGSTSLKFSYFLKPDKGYAQTIKTTCDKILNHELASWKEPLAGYSGTKLHRSTVSVKGIKSVPATLHTIRKAARTNKAAVWRLAQLKDTNDRLETIDGNMLSSSTKKTKKDLTERLEKINNAIKSDVEKIEEAAPELISIMRASIDADFKESGQAANDYNHDLHAGRLTNRIYSTLDNNGINTIEIEKKLAEDQRALFILLKQLVSIHNVN